MKGLETLNPQQRAAVTHTGGPLLILAGAGSGKTRVITYRIAHLIHTHEARPEQILAVTFTNKAANEMRERAAALIGAQAKSVTLSTFHSLGLRILRAHAREAGLRPDFTIYNEGDQMSLLRTLLREHPQKREKFDAGIILSHISRAKCQQAAAGGELPLFGDKYDLVFGDLYEQYQRQLRACQAVDFDDLIVLPIHLLAQNKEILKEYRHRFRHLLVDEYQDTNASQYRMLKLLAGDGKRLCVVGDDDQSIYGWRGAEVRNILQFERDFHGATVVKLEQNYRSTQTILDAAYHVIKNNAKRQPKRLWTERGKGRLIDAFLAKDEADEAKTIAWRLQTIQERTKAPWRAFAVLYRSNVQSRAIESALRIAKIPYNLVGGYEYFERKEVKDLVAYLRAVVNPGDDLNLLRIINYPRRGVGDQTIVRITDEAHQLGESVFDALRGNLGNDNLTKSSRDGIAQFVSLIDELRDFSRTHPPADVVRAAIERSGYREELQRTIDDAMTLQMKTETVEELASAAAAYQEQSSGATLSGFLDSIALDDDAYNDKGKKKNIENAVMLVTLHSAKGLEFPYVFLCGMEEDLLPHARSVRDGSEVDEERRLCYVGITRAQKHLTLSLVEERMQFGRRKKRTPSRFIKEIPPDLICKQFSHSVNFFDRQKPSNGSTGDVR
ncbi:MAG: AAA family ATPase [bacterium]|nr:AAA family ATPase [bacterium]